MNLAPVRGSYLDRYCGASPAHNMRPLQGQQRELMSCGGDRGKPLSWNMSPFQGQRRCANLRRRSEAQHCSSLCSQSEGGEYCGGQALKIQQCHAPERWVFKIQKNLCAVLSQIASGEACAHDKRTKREKERPERAVSS